MTHPVAILGAGVVGGRAARELVSGSSVRVALGSDRPHRREELSRAFGDSASVSDDAGAASDRTEVVVLAGRGAGQAEQARTHLEAGRHVVATAGGHEVVSELLDLEGAARSSGVCIVVGTGFSPGLTDVLLAWAADRLGSVDEARFARLGAAGPACDRESASILDGEAPVLRDGAFVTSRAGTGRELCWFPDPVGGRDSYLASSAEPLMATVSVPGVQRASARMAVPPLRRLLHAVPALARSGGDTSEGGVGAVRVEVRGTDAGGRSSIVLGALDRPGVAAAALVAEVVVALLEGSARPGVLTPGRLVDPSTMLRRLRTRGVRVAELSAAVPDA